MGLTSEIYLTKKYISQEEWQILIDVISNYNKILRPWKLIIINDKNRIRYFAKTNCTLPSTINNLNNFLLKPVKNIKQPKTMLSIPSITKIGSNIIDLINYNIIRNKGKLLYLEINLIKIKENKIRFKINYYLQKNNTYKKYLAIFSFPTSILSVDFEGNKRFFYRSPPKYLDINKIIHLLNTDYTNALLKVDTFPYLQGKFYLNQNNFSFDKHSIIIGSSGCGKSKFISLLINNIYKNKYQDQKYKVVVIDPHASLEKDIGGIGRVIDFKKTNDSIDLFNNSSEDIISSTELLLDLFKNLINDQYNSKLERTLRHSIYLLLLKQIFNFRNLRNLLLDLEFRNNLIKELKYELPISVIDFFLADFNELKTKSYSEAISPIIGFIDEMEMLPVFNIEKQKNDLKDTINNNFLTLFSLDITKLGNKVTKTISGLIMQQLLILVQKKEINEHIIFIIDEVARVENPILSRFLSETRKYDLSLILAGQYFNQISNELKDSIFANVINYYIFRVSKLDAITLVENFNMKIPLDDSKEQKIKLLTELNNRECIVRIDSHGILLPAFKGSTLDFNSIPRNIKLSPIKEEKFKEKSLKNLSFKLNPNIDLKKILLSTSSDRKGVKK